MLLIEICNAFKSTYAYTHTQVCFHDHTHTYLFTLTVKCSRKEHLAAFIQCFSLKMLLTSIFQAITNFLK